MSLEKTRSTAASSDARYRSLFDSFDQGFCIVAPVHDEAGTAVDCVFIEVNHAFEAQSGLRDVCGKRLGSLVPWVDAHWLATIDGVARTGVSARFEMRSDATDGHWYEIVALPMGDPAPRQVAVLFRDIDDRRRMEARLRASEERQAFLLHLSDALRPLEDPEEIRLTAASVLGRRLGANRVAYAEHVPDARAFVITRNYVDGVADVVGAHPYEAYGPDLLDDLTSGRIRVQPDTARQPDLDPEQRAALARFDVAASLNVPLVKNGRLVAFLGVNFASPHVFASAEIELVREVAERTWDAVERARTGLALRKSEQYFKAVVMAGSYTVFRMSADWRFLHQLDSTMLSCTPAPIDDWLVRYVPPSDHATVTAAVDRAIATRSLFELEHRVWLDDGSIGWVMSRAVPLLEADGEIVEWFGAGTIVTERRQAQEQLRERDARYRFDLERQVTEQTRELQESRDLLQATMDSSLDMIQVFRAVRNADGRIVDFRWILNNHTAERFYGDVIGKRLIEANPGVVETGIFDAFKRVVETGEPDVSERRYEHEQFDDWFYQSAVKLDDGVATTTKAIGDWKRAQADVLRLQGEVAEARLRESDARSQGLFADLALASWEADDAGNLVAVTPSWSAYTGQMTDRATGRGWLEAMHPGDRVVAERLWRDAVARNVPINAEFRLRHEDSGTWRWMNVRAVPVLHPSGRVEKWIGMNLDIHDRKLAEDRIRASEERLRNAVEVGGMGLWDWELASGEVHWSEEHFRLQGYAIGEVAPSYEAWAARIHPQDREDAERRLQAAMQSRNDYICEFRVLHPNGDVRWMSSRGRFFYADQGQPIRMIGAMMDVTERREWAEQQAILIAELQHRTRNLIGVVLAIADNTISSSGDLIEFRRRFQDRLKALARVQSLLSRLGEHNRITFDEVIRSEIAALGDGADRVLLEGPPDIPLKSSTVQTLALAVHELATNAIKHGALSQPQGRLRIEWRVASGHDDRPWLHVDWCESGVSIVPKAVQPGHGQGLHLIEEALPYQINAQVDFKLHADGARCKIVFPIVSA
ncbi:MAG: PAS domain-containing protein [Luteimonas sp.]